MIDDMLIEARFNELDRVLDKIYAARRAKEVLAQHQPAEPKFSLLAWLGITAPTPSRVEKMEPVPVRIRWDQ